MQTDAAVVVKQWDRLGTGDTLLWHWNWIWVLVLLSCWIWCWLRGAPPVSGSRTWWHEWRTRAWEKGKLSSGGGWLSWEWSGTSSSVKLNIKYKIEVVKFLPFQDIKRERRRHDQDIIAVHKEWGWIWSDEEIGKDGIWILQHYFYWSWLKGEHPPTTLPVNLFAILTFMMRPPFIDHKNFTISHQTLFIHF